jgi:hypothetical protein
VLTRRSAATRNTGRRRRAGVEGERWRCCCCNVPAVDETFVVDAVTVDVISIVSVHVVLLSPFLSGRPFLAGAGAAGR